MKGTDAHINLNYENRKAVINLSLSQLKSITSSTEDMRAYPKVFAPKMFADSDSLTPRKLKVKVLLSSEYEDKMQIASEDSILKIQDLEEQVRVLIEDKEYLLKQVDELKEELHNKELSITELKKDKSYISKDAERLKSNCYTYTEKIESLEDDLSKLKDAKFYEYIIKRDKVGELLQELLDLGFFKYALGYHKKIIREYQKELRSEELIKSTTEELLSQDNKKSDE